MIKKSTLLHLRFPFSYFLLPVYLFSLSISPSPHWGSALGCFLIVHFLLYPASNGYNSYFDKDEDPIGGLKHPPPVSKELYWVSLLFDALAVLLGWLISWPFALMVFIYGLVSRAYSHPRVRIKKYPIASWVIAGLFQGWFTFLFCYLAINQVVPEQLLTTQVQVPAFLSSALLWGSYPMTQIYQHQADAQRGDRTLSMLLGIRGTFHFTAIFFTLAMGGFLFYFSESRSVLLGMSFLIFMLPVLFYFGYWYLQVRKNTSLADHRHTMRLNFISASCLNLFFLLLAFNFLSALG